MNGLGLIVMGPWPQFTVALALTSALTSATAGTSRSKASWTDRAEEGEGMAARPAPAASTRAHRTLDARALIGAAPDILALLAGIDPERPPGCRRPVVRERAFATMQEKRATNESDRLLDGAKSTLYVSGRT